MTDSETKPTDREVPILAVFADRTGQYVVEVNARDGDELDAAFAHLATAFARALARPENRP